jgi:hypothetical protein
MYYAHISIFFLNGLCNDMKGRRVKERWLLAEGLTQGELRDEIYCQWMKQLSGNPNLYILFLLCFTGCQSVAGNTLILTGRVCSGECSFVVCFSSHSHHPRTSRHICSRTCSRRRHNKRVESISWLNTVSGGWRSSPRRAQEANCPPLPRSRLPQ